MTCLAQTPSPDTFESCTRRQDLYDIRVLKAYANFLFAIEPLVKYDIALELKVRHFEGNRATRQRICGLEYRSHATASQQLIELILVQFVAYHRIAHNKRRLFTN